VKQAIVHVLLFHKQYETERLKCSSNITFLV